MGNSMENSSTVQSRGLVEIVYSTTTGTSKLAADKLQQVLQDNKYLAPVTDIGDYPHQELLNHNGTIIFLLSTYGDGSSPNDGEAFLSWIQNIKPNKQFSNLHYSILAFGNSNFQNHCGFAIRAQKVFNLCGAKSLYQLTKCDVASKETAFEAKFPNWSKMLVQKLNLQNPLQNIPRHQLGNPFQVTCEQKANFNWESNVDQIKNVGQQFLNYWEMKRCKVIHIKELRKDAKGGRSTLWVRLQMDKNIDLSPGCNIQVFPINSLQNDPRDHFIVTFNQVKCKVAYPPMPLREIRKLLDYKQTATPKLIKNAILLATCQNSVCEEYNRKLKEKVQLQLTVKQLMSELKPKLEIIPFINLNRVRTYTLSSWDKQNRYMDLTISLLPNGLTSNYIQSFPQYLHIKSIPSSFYIPQGRPIAMIANGSGIAPFRSITQYFAHNSHRKPQYLRLYYGIQSAEVDFYYKEEWIEFQRQGLIQIKIAESRKDPQRKEYVQNVLEKDINWLHEHLFKNNGVIFICGGGGMCRQVNNIIFNAIAIETKVPYKAFSLSAQLKHQKTIVQEAFD